MTYFEKCFQIIQKKNIADTALTLSVNLINFFIFYALMISLALLSPSVRWMWADRANQSFTASFLHTSCSFPLAWSKVFQGKQNPMEFMTWLLPGGKNEIFPKSTTNMSTLGLSSGSWFRGVTQQVTCHLQLGTDYSLYHLERLSIWLYLAGRLLVTKM